MVLFQNGVRQLRSPVKMAATVQLRCYWKQLWSRWAITGSWEPLVLIPAHCHLLDFDSYAPCNDVIFSQSTRGFHFLSFEYPENWLDIIIWLIFKPRFDSYRTCAFCKARSDWLQLPLAALHINRHRVTPKIRPTMPRVKMSRADRNPWLAKMILYVCFIFLCRDVVILGMTQLSHFFLFQEIVKD